MDRIATITIDAQYEGRAARGQSSKGAEEQGSEGAEVQG